jgi:hypothetical protein
MNFKKSQLIISSLITLGLIGLTWFLLRPQATVTLRLAPSSATLAFNNTSQSVSNGQSLQIKPGNYTFTFSRDEFSTEKKTIEIKNHDNITVTMALAPQTDAARKLINDNPESVKIAAEYKEQRVTELAASMPVTGTGFSIKTCPSVKYPATDKKAFCIVTANPNSERLGRLYLKELGYNLDDLEILVGSSNLMTVMKTATYKVEAYITDTADKQSLYITPLNVPYVSLSEPYNAQLEALRTTALAELEAAGYPNKNYEIVFSNNYLTRYNVDHDQHTDNGHNLE